MSAPKFDIKGLQDDEKMVHDKLLKVADELEQKDATKYATVIERCRNGDYLDFGSQHATPKMLMHKDLLEVGLTEIDQRMQDGDFDT